MLKSAEYQRGYDAGYKQALLDALRPKDVDYSAPSKQSKRALRWNGI